MKIDARCGDKGWRRRKLLGVWLILAHLAYAIVMAVTNQVHVRFGSKADITWSYRNVPFYLRKRTYTGGIGMSALCQ